MIRPLGNRVLVKRLEQEDKIGSLHIPDAAKEKPQRGEVIAIGKGKFSESGEFYIPPSVEIGDRIYFPKYGGLEVRENNEEFLIIKDEDILGVIE